MALAETAKVMTELGLRDKLTPGLAKATSSLNKFDSRLGKVGGGLGKVSAGLARAGTIVAGAAVTGLGAAAKAAIDFEDAFQGVVKTVDEADLKKAGLSFDDLRKSIRQMATEMPNSVLELSAIAESAGALGIAGKDIESFTRQVAILASTTDVSAEDAATALGQLSNVIKLTGDDYDNFAAALVDLGNKGASTESQILEITRRSGGAAQNIDLAKDATLGWAAAAANLGLQQELAGTALQRFFLQSQNLVNSKGGLKAMAEVAGVSAKAFKKAFKEDASGALESFLKGLGKMPKDARLKAIQDLFGKGTGLTRLILGLSDSIDTNLTPSLDTSTQAWKDATAAQAEFDKRNATVKSAILRLKNGIYDAAITIGEGFTPALANAATKLSEFLRLPENQKALKDLGKDIGDALDGVDWQAVLSGAREFVSILKVGFDWAKRMFDIFNALPTEVKGAAAGFLALNKLSGGLIGGGLGDIAGALGKGALGKVPGINKLVAQPVVVTNWPPGFGGAGAGGAAGGIAGKLGGALSIASIVTSVASVIATQQAVSGSSTAQSEAIRSGLDSSIAGKTIPQLKTALAGVDQGITDLSSNPLYALVQGEALDNLRAMKSSLEAALNRPGGDAGLTGKAADDKSWVTIAQNTRDTSMAVVASRERLLESTGGTTKSVDSAKLAIDGAKRATEYGASQVATAIRNKDLSVELNNKTVVTVNVSATGVKSTTTYQNRVGKSTGSHGGGSTGHAPGTGPLP